MNNELQSQRQCWVHAAAETELHVRIQERPGWHSKLPTSAMAWLLEETQTECHRVGWQRRRGRQLVARAVRRSCGPESTCDLCTIGEKRRKINWFKNFNFSVRKSTVVLFWHENTLVLGATYCSADCREPGSTGDDKRQQAKCVAQDFSVVRLREQFELLLEMGTIQHQAATYR